MFHLDPDNQNESDTPEKIIPSDSQLPLTIIETPTEKDHTHPDAFQIINGIRDEHFEQKPVDPKMNAWIIEIIRKRIEI